MDSECVKNLVSDVRKSLYDLSFPENVETMYSNVYGVKEKENMPDLSILSKKKAVLDFMKERMSEIYNELLENCSPIPEQKE